MFDNRNTVHVERKNEIDNGKRVKFTLQQAMKAHRGEKKSCVALFFLELWH